VLAQNWPVQFLALTTDVAPMRAIVFADFDHFAKSAISPSG
jgi:hypothetical protein